MFFSVFLSIAFSLCHLEGPVQQGLLDSNVSEASGIIVDDSVSTLLHINDSGDGPNLYSTDYTGNNITEKTIEGFVPLDVEDLAETTCGTSTCIVVADIGDNYKLRSDIQLIFIKREDYYSKETKIRPYHTLRLTYPDGAHNSEGISFDTRGNLFVITKEADDSKHIAFDAVVYHLPAKDVFSSSKEKLIKTGTLPLTTWLAPYTWLGKLVTSFDISKSNGSWLLLTYQNFLLIEPDFKTDMSQWKHKVISFDKNLLPQAEAIGFNSTGDKIFVTTEQRKSSRQPIMTWSCRAEEKTQN